MILLEIESHEHGRAPRQFKIENYTEEQIGFHVHLMGQAGLLKVADSTHMGSASPEAIPLAMTWQGYEFLEAAREPSRWQAATQKVKSAGAAMTIEIIKETLIALSKHALGLPA